VQSDFLYSLGHFAQGSPCDGQTSAARLGKMESFKFLSFVLFSFVATGVRDQ